jgi:hypothetical protein
VLEIFSVKKEMGERDTSVRFKGAKLEDGVDATRYSDRASECEK